MKIKFTIVFVVLLCMCSAYTANAASYEYDDLGRIVYVEYENGVSVSYSYDANGNMLTSIFDESQKKPTENPEENPEEKPEDKPGDKPGEKPEEKPDGEIDSSREDSLIKIHDLNLGDLERAPDKAVHGKHKGHNMPAGKAQNEEKHILEQFRHLFDEQGARTTPQTPTATVIDRPKNGWKDVMSKPSQKYPYSCEVVLDDYYTINYIGFYDAQNKGKIEIYDANTDKLIMSYGLDKNNEWNIIKVADSVSTDKIRIVKYDSARLNEMAFYGYKTAESAEEETKKDLSRKNIKGVELGEVSLSYDKRAQQELLTMLNNLFDEQQLLPEKADMPFDIRNRFKNKPKKLKGKQGLVDCIVTFEEPCEISKLGVFIEKPGKKNGKISIYDAVTDELLLETELVGKEEWMCIDLIKSVSTDKLKVVLSDTDAVCEIAFY